MLTFFDKYHLTLPPQLQLHEETADGKQAIFLSDKRKSFLISFEEEMPLMDLKPVEGVPSVCFQHCENGKYINVRRFVSKNLAFFHIELETESGATLHLPGQMTVNDGYAWADGVEPILLTLMNSINV